MAQQQADALALLSEAVLPPRARSRRPGPAIPSRGPHRRHDAGGSGSARSVRAGGRPSRSRGNVSAPGVRCQPCRDAARRGRAHRGGRGPDAHDSSRAAARAPSSRPELSLPGLPDAVRAGPSPPSLGARRSNHAVQSRLIVSTPSPRGARGGLSGRSTARRRSSVPATGRQAALPTSRRRLRCPPIPSSRSERSTTRGACTCTPGPRAPSWLGDRLDLSYAIDVLIRSANPLRVASTRRGPPAFDGCQSGMRLEKAVGVRELKTRLGSYLREVRRGQVIVVTDRGEPVAELRPIAAAKSGAGALGACRSEPASAPRRVQLLGGARRPGARRTCRTLSARTRAPTKQMGPYRRAGSPRRSRASHSSIEGPAGALSADSAKGGPTLRGHRRGPRGSLLIPSTRAPPGEGAVDEAEHNAPLCYASRMDTTIRNLDEGLYRELKAQAALAGRPIGELVNEAIRCYLARPGAGARSRSLRELTPEPYIEGEERLSEQIDAVAYGPSDR